MVDGINKTGPVEGQQTFSKKGVKLEQLKDNKLLFEYFKKAGYKEDGFIYESDIEKIKKAYDKNNNGLSVKEARKMGLNGSRKEIKQAIKTLDQVANTELKDGDNYPVVEDGNSTKYYGKDGKLKSRVVVGENGTTTATFRDGNEEQLDSVRFEGKQGYRQVNFNEHKKAEYIEVNDGFNTTKQKFVYADGGAGRLNYVEEEGSGGKGKKTTIYNDDNKPFRVVEDMGNGISKTINRTYNGDQLASETTEDDPALLRKGIKSQTVTYDGENVKEKVNTKTDGTTETIRYENGKEVPVEKTPPKPEAEKTEPKKYQVKEGEKLADIAKRHGVSIQDLLDANEGAYRKKKNDPNKGNYYFLKDQVINLPPNAKEVPEDPKTPVDPKTPEAPKNGIPKFEPPGLPKEPEIQVPYRPGMQPPKADETPAPAPAPETPKNTIPKFEPPGLPKEPEIQVPYRPGMQPPKADETPAPAPAPKTPVDPKTPKTPKTPTLPPGFAPGIPGIPPKGPKVNNHGIEPEPDNKIPVEPKTPKGPRPHVSVNPDLVPPGTLLPPWVERNQPDTPAAAKKTPETPKTPTPKTLPGFAPGIPGVPPKEPKIK